MHDRSSWNAVPLTFSIPSQWRHRDVLNGAFQAAIHVGYHAIPINFFSGDEQIPQKNHVDIGDNLLADLQCNCYLHSYNNCYGFEFCYCIIIIIIIIVIDIIIIIPIVIIIIIIYICLWSRFLVTLGIDICVCVYNRHRILFF